MRRIARKEPATERMRSLNVILDSIYEGLIAVNSKGIITIYNKAAERIMKISASKTLGRRASEVIPNSRLEVVLRTGRPELNQKQQVGDVTLVTNRVPVRDVRGRVTGVVAVFRDISEVLSQAEEITSLKQTEELLRAIINSTQDAISVVDENGMGILFNEAYTHLIGMTEDKVLNKPATVDIAEGESVHLRVLKTRRPIKGVPMKVGPKRREVVVDAAPIIVNSKLRGSVAVIHDVSEIHRLSRELEQAKSIIRRLEAKYTFDDIVGSSPGIQHAKQQAYKAAQIPATVLLRGESGTGKELFAHAIHSASSRSKGQFVRVNCSAIPGPLLESELFGYEEGAFTGARKGGRKGYFEEADKGTLFLDEIGELDINIQIKLLRVLQEKEIVKVGSSKPVPVDVRVIAATNANLEKLMREGKIRKDFYYRVSVIPIKIPPLRDRMEDIEELVYFLIDKLNQEFGRNVISIESQALDVLRTHSWPGNVRELENVLGRAIINLRPGEKEIRLEHIPPLNNGYTNQEFMPLKLQRYKLGKLANMKAQWEKEVIKEALEVTGGNRQRAAELLGISIRALYDKLKKYGLTGRLTGRRF